MFLRLIRCRRPLHPDPALNSGRGLSFQAKTLRACMTKVCFPVTSMRRVVLSTALSLCSAAVLAQATIEPLASPAKQTGTQALSLKELVNLLQTSNKTILSKRADRDIASTGIERASAAFETTANVSATNGQSRTKNTFEEDLVRKDLGSYRRDGQDYTVGVSQLFSSGAKVELKTTLSSFITNTNAYDPLRPPGAKDNRSTFGFTLTQPLARDAGFEVNGARLQVAKLDTVAADHASSDTQTSVVAEGVIAYHELVLAQHRMAAAQEKIRSGERLLAEARAMNRQGRLADSEVWEVENALARYASALSEARQGERERANRLRTLFMSASADSRDNLKATDALPAVAFTPISFEDSLGVALAKRDDYQMRKVMVQREGVQVAYAENQARSRIDLIASYGINGLEYSEQSAFNWQRMSDYPSWTLGVQLLIPLDGNRQGRADTQAAALRREDALLSLKAAEISIANDIDTSLALRASVAERWELWRQIAEREQKQLELELRKFTAGRSDVREVLQREERVINAKLSTVEQQAAYAKAQTMLDAAQGTLLERLP